MSPTFSCIPQFKVYLSFFPFCSCDYLTFSSAPLPTIPLFYIPPLVVYHCLTLFVPAIISPSPQLPCPRDPLLDSIIGGLSPINPFCSCYYLAFSSAPLPAHESLFYFILLVFIYLFIPVIISPSPQLPCPRAPPLSPTSLPAATWQCPSSA